MATLSDYASNMIVETIGQNPGLLLCCATGSSPTEVYRKVVGRKHEFATDKIRIIKLDEWGGIDSAHPESCESYLRNNLIRPLNIKEENYIAFDSNPAQPGAEVHRIQRYLDQNGPIDVCVLGLGMNGHIAFNEPADMLRPECHVATLADTSKKHQMFLNMAQKPGYGLTLGMANILQSRKIMLIVSGANKQQVIERLVKPEISTSLPASFLWLHSNTECLIVNQ